MPTKSTCRYAFLSIIIIELVVFGEMHVVAEDGRNFELVFLYVTVVAHFCRLVTCRQYFKAVLIVRGNVIVKLCPDQCSYVDRCLLAQAA